MMVLCIYYLCNSSISFAISVPILPAPRTVPEDIPGTLTKDCFTASVDKKKQSPNKTLNPEHFHCRARIHFKVAFILDIHTQVCIFIYVFRNDIPLNTDSWQRALQYKVKNLFVKIVVLQ